MNPRCTQIIAHSLGTVAAAQAAACLSDMGPFAQLTLLDPPSSMHEEIFCEALPPPGTPASSRTTGRRASAATATTPTYRGVRNYTVEGENPIIGIVDLSLSNHVLRHAVVLRHDALPHDAVRLPE